MIDLYLDLFIPHSHRALNRLAIMRIAALALVPLLAVPAAADLAQDAFQWAADIIDGKTAPAPKADNVHIMDSWEWSDCGECFITLVCESS